MVAYLVNLSYAITWKLDYVCELAVLEGAVGNQNVTWLLLSTLKKKLLKERHEPRKLKFKNNERKK